MGFKYFAALWGHWSSSKSFLAYVWNYP